MKIMEKAVSWLKSRVSPHYPRQPELLAIIEESFKEWQTVQNQYNHINPDLIDYMIYRLSAAEKHYTALLAQAKAEGVKAWPDNLTPHFQQWAE